MLLIICQLIWHKNSLILEKMLVVIQDIIIMELMVEVSMEIFLMEMVWDNLVMVIQLSFVKSILYRVMELTSARIGTILLLYLQGIKQEEILMAILGLVKGILEGDLEIQEADFLMVLMAEGLILNLAMSLLIIMLEISICQEVQDIKAM